MPGATARLHSFLTYSPRARPTSSRLVFQSSRWLRHQHTEESEFLGPSMVATSSKRAIVAGLTTKLIVSGYAGVLTPFGGPERTAAAIWLVTWGGVRDTGVVEAAASRS